MGERLFNPAMAGSVAVSLLLHVTVLVPLWMLAMNSPIRLSQVDPELQMDDATTSSMPEQPKLGLDVPSPSSLIWVGYEEYREHIAALAEFEQAAFTQNPGTPMPEAAMTQEQVQQERASEIAPQATEPLAELAEVTDEGSGEPEPTVVELIVSAPIIVPLDMAPGDLPWMRPVRVNREPIPAAALPAEVAEAPQEDVIEESQPADEPAEPQEPRPSSAGGTAGETPSAQSDRESHAFSTIEADLRHWRDGQPLAAHGVEVKPQQPHFTLLQRMSASPGNPLVVIRFRSDGVPADASVVQSSGSASVDASIEASLFRWRATGEAIDRLGERQTFDVRIRIILNPRAATANE